VGPLIERAATTEVETRMVPVASENAIVDRAAIQREPHMRTTIVERVNAATRIEQCDQPAAGLNYLLPARGNRRERGNTDVAAAAVVDGHRPAPSLDLFAKYSL